MSSSHSRSSSASSSLSGSPPRLDPSVLELLTAFIADREEEDRRFKALEAEHAAAQIAGLDIASADAEEKPMVSVAEYKRTFGEDWQLSQFWYSNAFSEKLSKDLHAMCTSDTKIAFLCCPTSFVGFQHMKPLKDAYLFEYDQRFVVLSPNHYIPFDLDNPDVFPERFRGYFSIVVVDPPFLNEVTNRKLVTTLGQIMEPDAKLLLITSTSVEGVLEKVYTEAPLGPLKRTALVVEHEQLANDFAAWGSWDGAENFGESGTPSSSETYLM